MAIREVVKANGGPLGLVVVGGGMAVWSKLLGGVVALIGVVWFVWGLGLVRRLREKSPYTLRSPITRRGRRIDPEAVQVYMKARRARRGRVRKLKGMVRAGTELQQDCERRSEDSAAALAPSTSVFGFGGFGTRVETWTKEVDKVLEGGPDKYLDRFHEACVLPPPSEAITDEEIFAAKIRTRVEVLRQIVAEMEAQDSP